MIDIPRHIGRLRIVNVEQLALVMAGLFECDDVDAARQGNYIGWREAQTYKETLIQAIKLNEIKPLRVYLWDADLRDGQRLIGDIDKLSVNSNVIGADFLAHDAWAWAEKELSGDSLLPGNNPVSSQSDYFNGKDTAMMIMAGLAIAVYKSSDSFKRSGKINISAVIRATESAINEYGNGVEVTNRAIRDWIRPAIEQFATKLPD